VLSVNVSRRKGERKTPVGAAVCRADFGFEGDAHAGAELRQISLLADESAAKIRARGLAVGPGDFAENLTTTGVELLTLPLGARLKIGKVLLEITQIGKICHDRCAIYEQTGDCVMPREGVFARVVAGGEIRPGSAIEICRTEDAP
jgi:MOSC domain-containing protein YiiM